MNILRSVGGHILQYDLFFFVLFDPFLLEQPFPKSFCVPHPELHRFTVQNYYYKPPFVHLQTTRKTRTGSGRYSCFYADVELRFALQQLMSVLPSDCLEG